MSDARLRELERAAAAGDPDAAEALRAARERVAGERRDPRVDPRPDDMVRRADGRVVRLVVTLTEPVLVRERRYVHWVRICGGGGPRSGCCLLASWRSWARGGEAIEIEDE